MHILPDLDPFVRSRRPFDPNKPSGGEITCGNIGKLAEAAAENRAAIAKLEASVVALEKLATDGLAKTAGLQATIADEINKNSLRGREARG